MLINIIRYLLRLLFALKGYKLKTLDTKKKLLHICVSFSVIPMMHQTNSKEIIFIRVLLRMMMIMMMIIIMIMIQKKLQLNLLFLQTLIVHAIYVRMKSKNCIVVSKLKSRKSVKEIISESSPLVRETLVRLYLLLTIPCHVMYPKYRLCLAVADIYREKPYQLSRMPRGENRKLTIDERFEKQRFTVIRQLYPNDKNVERVQCPHYSAHRYVFV